MLNLEIEVHPSQMSGDFMHSIIIEQLLDPTDRELIHLAIENHHN